jgi:hypothetical protein
LVEVRVDNPSPGRIRDDFDYHDSKVIGVVLDPDTGDPRGLPQDVVQVFRPAIKKADLKVR